MHAFTNETNLIITHLQECYSKINIINNPEMQWLKNKILRDIKGHIDSLKLQLGIEPEIISPGGLQTPMGGPIKKMFGKDIRTTAPQRIDVNKPINQTPEDVAYTELQLKVDELYPRILSTPSDHLLDSISDIEMRGIAKRAGLPVTETNPARITVEYVEKIKQAARAQLSSKPIISEPTSVSRAVINEVEDYDISEIKVLYSDFLNIETRMALDNIPHIQIRAVGKMAGLPVTETSPAKVDGNFIRQIRNAINKKKELEKIGNV